MQPHPWLTLTTGDTAPARSKLEASLRMRRETVVRPFDRPGLALGAHVDRLFVTELARNPGSLPYRGGRAEPAVRAVDLVVWDERNRPHPYEAPA